jgi:integrase
MRLRLTESVVRKLRSPLRGRLVIFDEQQPGLMLRVTPNGVRTFAVWFRRRNGSKETLTLGKLGDLSVTSARTLAKQTRFEVMAGAPLSAAKRKQPALYGDVTVAEAVQRYGTAYLERQGLRTTEDIKRRLNKEVVEIWGKRPLRDIERSDVHALLDGIIDRGAPKSANGTLALLRGFLNWAVSRELINANPCSGIRRPIRTSSRTRVLREEELRRIWRATSRVATSADAFHVIVKLLILTAARRTEVAGMSWPEIHFGKEVWSLPPERSKNRREHILPLCDEVLTTLSQWRAIQNSDGLLFPSRRTPDRHFSGYGKCLSRLRAQSGTADWGLHDLRRTCATWLEERGTAPHVVSKILNHTMPGVGAVYMRADHQVTMRQALENWERFVCSLS